MSDLIKGEPLNHSFARIINKDCAVEDRRTSEIFLTRPEYLNRLFKGIGYKNRNVVTILDEYANMTVDKADEDTTDQIYVNRDNSSCFVSTKEDILKVNILYLKICEIYGEDNVEVCRYDDYYYWDQVTVKVNGRVSFVMYVDLCDRYIESLTVIKNDEGLVVDICKEGKFKIEEEDFVDNLLLSLEVSASLTTPGQAYLDSESFKLSVEETIELLSNLGLVNKKRGKAYMSDYVSEEELDKYKILDNIDLYNSKKPLARRVCFEDSCFKIKDIEELVTESLSSNVTPWSLVKFYQNIDNENTDYFQLID